MLITKVSFLSAVETESIDIYVGETNEDAVIKIAKAVFKNEYGSHREWYDVIPRIIKVP